MLSFSYSPNTLSHEQFLIFFFFNIREGTCQLYVRGSEKISHMSEILGMDFFAYLDAGGLPEHFAF